MFSGPDRTGKTTQIKNLKKYLEEKGELAHVLHYSNIKGNNIRERSEEYYKQMFKLIKCATNNQINLIFDRCHDGEAVYGPIYRDYSGDFVYEIESAFGNKILQNIILFVFIDNPERLIGREDGESFTVELEKKKNEINKFIEFHDQSKIKNKKLINIVEYSPEQVFEEMKNYLEGKYV